MPVRRPQPAGVKRPTISNIQFLRFAAAAAVLFSHTCDLLLPPTSFVWAVPWSAGVDLFFVISGFIMAWLTHGQFGEPGAAPRFLRGRIVRIVPPYWLFTGLMILTVLFLGEHVRHTTIDPDQIATSLAFVPWPRHGGQINPILSQGWTLNYEAFFYACFALAMMARRGLLGLGVAFVALAALHPLVPDSWFVLKFYSQPIILEFLGGIGLARLYIAGERLSPVGSGLCAAGAILSYFLLRDLTDRVLYFGVPALALAAAFMLAPEPRRLGPVRRFLRFGGDSSYTLYLSHTFTVNGVVLLWRSLGVGPPVVAIFAALAVAVAAAMLFYSFVEAPFTRWLGDLLRVRVAYGPASVAP
jgi:peptidoglycan/LPS O-acetylase OafA/YrhL